MFEPKITPLPIHTDLKIPPEHRDDALGSAVSGFLRYLQTDNACAATGVPCRASGQCGCMLEMELWIRSVLVGVSDEP